MMIATIIRTVRMRLNSLNFLILNIPASERVMNKRILVAVIVPRGSKTEQAAGVGRCKISHLVYGAAAYLRQYLCGMDYV